MLVSEQRLLDAAGRPRSPATMPGYHAGRPPRNKGIRYPADPPRVEEIVSVMGQAGPGIHGARLRGLIVVLWRAGLRISEGLCLAERDLDPARGALLVRNGKGGSGVRSGWTSGLGAASPVARPSRSDADRRALLRRQRADLRAPVVWPGRTNTASAARPRRRSETPFRSSPAPSRPCRRDGPGGRAPERHPAPARPRRPRRHVGLSAGN
jgi:hypothetical protein